MLVTVAHLLMLNLNLRVQMQLPEQKQIPGQVQEQ